MRRAIVGILLLAPSCVSEPATAPAAAVSTAEQNPGGEEPTASSIEVGTAPLDGASASLDALGRAIVDALNASDRDALLSLTVTADEYKQRLFGELANHPNAHTVGPDLMWDMHSSESLDDMERALDRNGGKNLVFVSIEPELRKDRGEIVIHKSPNIRVKDADDNEHVLEILGPVVEHVASGGFKVLAFKDD